MESQLEELVAHENITIHNDFVHMDANCITLQIHVEIYQTIFHGHE
jgi:hypothetical protein